MSKWVEIILPLAIRNAYTYRVPDTLSCPQPGMRVVVPLAAKEMVGIVNLVQDEAPDIEPEKIRDIITVLDSEPSVTQKQLDLWRWIANYYMCNLGQVMEAAIPRKLQDRQYSLDPSIRRRIKLPQYEGETSPLKTLSFAQQRATDEVKTAFLEHPIVILQGVTSSGKTEVYMHLIHEQLEQGKQVLYLVPEIALTTQLTERLKQVFGNKLYVYHSRVSDGQRAELYRQVLQFTWAKEKGTSEPKGQLIVGARSAVFLPLVNPGLIILDEEHEPSYKQQDPAPRYHARSVAVMLGKQFGCKVLLGTATPSVDTLYNAKNGKYGHVQLTERYAGIQLPIITLIDLERQYHRREMYGHFSDPLVARIREELSKGKQVILFQNRRGYAPYISCTQCGQVPTCSDCDVAMTVHLSARLLTCHYCGQTQPFLSRCPKCGGEMRIHGFGTERLEDEVRQYFPEARIARMDLDTTRHKDDYQTIIDDFAAHKVDILIGTQLVSKGLHFDDVSLVAVLNADHLLNQPSFRSYERAFQMLEQVSGRAGRHGSRGEVMIQTFDPEHPLYALLQEHQTDTFLNEQLKERESFHLPPYSRMIILTLKHNREERLLSASEYMHQRLVYIFGTRCSNVILPSITRIQSQYIRQINLRFALGENISKAKEMLQTEIDAFSSQPEGKGVNVIADIDPL
ncbi:MAG: primosomal protein N' [Paludibacteraceae bacterium]|nr:primosomal protein N' [Paludibacteraceae bacterium]